MRLIIILALFVIGTDTTIRLIKKKLHDGLKFSRTIKYTNETIVEMKNSSNSNLTQELSLDLLMVADFSTYQAFLEMSNGDAAAARHHLTMYLGALFEQTKLIYENIKFRNETLVLKFAGVFIAFREEDCPLWLTFDTENEENQDVASPEELDKIFNETLFDDNSTNYLENNVTFEEKKARQFVGVSLEELEKANGTEMSLRIDSKLAIDKFTLWIKHYAEFLPRHEHAVLVTKFDLVSISGHSATQGMAYVGNICQLGESSSVVEDIGASLTALIAAHEIGHSLGAVHDGAYEAADCDSNDNYLLAAAVSGSTDRQSFLNSRTMSNCSIESILDNLKRPSANCVKKWKDNRQQNRSQTHETFSKKPGESISLMQQCQIAFGPTFGPCRNMGYFYGETICQRVWCNDRKDYDGDLCQTLNYFPAFDGTECGYNMWCIQGECVKNPKKWMDCKDMNAKTCSRYSPSKLKHFCKSKDFREICCKTCSNSKKVRRLE